MSKQTKVMVGVLGCGRLGSAISAALRSSGEPFCQLDSRKVDSWSGLDCDVVINSASAEVTDSAAEYCASVGAALIDCTGAEIGQGYPNTVRLAQRLPVVCAPNLSYSHHLQLEAVRLVSESIEGALAYGLVNKPSVSVRDRHPIWKSTAPSATAVRLVAAVGEGNAELDTSITVSRRGGPVADHGFDVDWDYESLRITQTVESLEVSARTAVWLTKHVPHLCAGIYQLTDLLAELRFEF